MIENYPKNWLYVAVAAGTKSPTDGGWNVKENCLSQDDAATEVLFGGNIGIAHAYSNTCALDIDDYDTARLHLDSHGIDLDALLDAHDAVQIVSGRSGSYKLLYALPAPLVSKVVKVDGATSYEFRCSTSTGLTVQDLLPPSMHPTSGKDYKWSGAGSIHKLPKLPESLKNLWLTMIEPKVLRSVTTDTSDCDWVEIERALSCCDADCGRDEWIKIGMALHHAAVVTDNLQHAFELFDKFSSVSKTKYTVRETNKQWSSFTVDKNITVTIASLFAIASDYGYHKIIDAQALFASVDVPTTTIKENVDSFDDLFGFDDLFEIDSPAAAEESEIKGMFGAVAGLSITAPKVETIVEKVTKTVMLTPGELNKKVKPGAITLDYNLIPDSLMTYSELIGETIGCDPLTSIFAGLGAVCSAADSQSRLELIDGYEVPPVLWLMTLGNPAEKKSPGSKPMFKPLEAIAKADNKRFVQAMLKYEGEEAAYAKEKKMYIDFAASGEAALGGDMPSVRDAPIKPAPLCLTVTDITSQKLVRVCADNPRGVTCVLDEMSSWVRKMTDKNSGEDRSSWVVAYESDAYQLDRVGTGTTIAENMSVSVAGNLQPAVFQKYIKDLASDGLIQRFIPAILDSKKTKLGNPERISDVKKEAANWDMTLRKIYAAPKQKYTLSGDAYKEFRHFQAWVEDMKQDYISLKMNNSFMAAFGKIEGTCGRIAFAFHLLENPESNVVSAETMTKACRFICDFVIPSLKHMYITMSGEESLESWLIDHVLQHADESLLTVSGIRRSARRQVEGMTLSAANESVVVAMQTLILAGWVATTTEDHSNNKNTWAVNPSVKTLFDSQRKEMVAKKQKTLDGIYTGRTEKQPNLPRKTVHGA